MNILRHAPTPRHFDMRSRLLTRLGPLTAAAGASVLLHTAACSGASASAPQPDYAYHPPARTSAALAAAAAAASLPRARIPASPLPRVLFVLGGPGAGKGTQCALLAERYGFAHLSAGDLLREERLRGGPVAEMIEATIRDGRIVPVEVTVGLIKAAMAASSCGKFLVDGFPRNFDNVGGWERVMGDTVVVDGVLQYEAPEDVLVARLLERGKSSGRSDDNEESIRKRLRTYLESTLPGAARVHAAGLPARYAHPPASPPPSSPPPPSGSGGALCKAGQGDCDWRGPRPQGSAGRLVLGSGGHGARRGAGCQCAAAGRHLRGGLGRLCCHG